MNSPLRRLRRGLAILAFIFLVAVLGYRVAGWNLLDATYMAIITLFTVGFRDDVGGVMTPPLKVFTMALIIFGASTVLYILGGLVQMMTEGEINRALGLRRITREIRQLSGHVILCGFGRMGETLAAELRRVKQVFVVVDNDPARVAEATTLNYLAIHDDATEEQVLQDLGLERAKALVTTLPKDADNLFITLTARNLNSQVQIIARAEYRSTEKKLIQAGADRVVLPAAAGAMRMAAMITRPSTVELVELAAGRNVAEVTIDELTIPPDCPLVGRTVRETEPRSRHGLLIVAIRRPNQTLEFNPDANTVFEGGGSVIVMGRSEDIERFRHEYGI
ncbi:MAG TPA: potassium channel protein [Planctomycetaceae bacterium]|nr:potassium channel protein [Planctomycetaceae bacterium]